MQKMTAREVLRSKGFRMMALGFAIAVIGALFAAMGLLQVAQGLVVFGIMLGLVGLVMHTRLFMSAMRNKDNTIDNARSITGQARNKK